MSKTITIPDAEPTNQIHGSETVVGLYLDSDGYVAGRFEQQPKTQVEVRDDVDTVKLLSDRSKLENHPVDERYTDWPDDWKSLTLSQAQAQRINEVKEDAQTVLAETDWYVTREQETGKSIPQNILDHRSKVRSQSDTFEQDINDLGTVEKVLNYSFSFPDPPQS